MLFIALTLSISDAGKLEEGFRGVPWGASLVESPESMICEEVVDDADALWSCAASIGDTPVEVIWMGYPAVGVYGVGITAAGYTACTALLATARGAYGPGSPRTDTSVKTDRLWSDGGVVGSWSFNQYSAECSLTLLSLPLYKAAQTATDAASAAKGAGDM
mgnify:CR=1 FL=1